MIDPNLDHVGIVVPKVDSAVEALTQHLGLSWMGIFEPVLPMHDAVHGVHEVKLRIALTEHYPRLEIIEALPDSPWALADNDALLHHLAYFAGDLAGDSQHVAAQCPIEIAGVGAEGELPRTFTYHLLDGLRFELLERRPPGSRIAT